MKKYISIFLVCTIMFLSPCGVLFAQSIPKNGSELLRDDSLLAVLNGKQKIGNFTRLSSEGEIQLQCETKKTGDNPWDFQILLPIKEAVEKNDVLLLHFFAKNVSDNAKTDSVAKYGHITPFFQKNSPEYEKLFQLSLELGDDFKEYSFPFKAMASYAAGQTACGFFLGYQKQTVIIHSLTLTNYRKSVSIKDLPSTKIYYKGQDPKALWRQEAIKRIEKIRKSDMTIQVQDKNGTPIPNADVSVAMTRHAFGFGSAVNARLLTDKSPDAVKYQKIVEECFSRVVFENDLKWLSWERGHDRTLEAVDWLRDRGIEIRGHCLIWPSWRYTPGDLRTLADKTEILRKRINQHIMDETSTLKGKIYEWDVINEPYTNNDVMKVLGDEEMISWFKIAHQGDPNAKLALNDFSIIIGGGHDQKHQDHFYNTLRFLKEGGAPISSLGIQGHFGRTVTPPERILEILDRYAGLNLEITITEHDIDTNDEELQADFTRDLLIVLFSHPGVIGVLNWGFWERAHWRPNSAYYRADWSIKPAGEVWRDLVLRQWWTKDNGKTDSGGIYKIRGFLGDYNINVSIPGKSKSIKTKLEKKGTNLIIHVD